MRMRNRSRKRQGGKRGFPSARAALMLVAAALFLLFFMGLHFARRNAERDGDGIEIESEKYPEIESGGEKEGSPASGATGAADGGDNSAEHKDGNNGGEYEDGGHKEGESEEGEYKEGVEVLEVVESTGGSGDAEGEGEIPGDVIGPPYPLLEGGKAVGIFLSGSAGEEGGRTELLLEALEKAECPAAVHYAEGRQEEQTSAVLAAIENSVGILVVEPVNPMDRSLSQAADLAMERGIPFVSYCSLLQNSMGVGWHVAYDPYVVGDKVAEQMISELQPEPGIEKNIEIFAGDPEDPDLLYNYPGLMIKLFPYIQNASIRVPSNETEMEQVTVFDFSEEAAAERMRRLLNSYYNIGAGNGERRLDAVICMDERMFSGIQRVLLEVWPPVARDVALAETGSEGKTGDKTSGGEEGEGQGLERENGDGDGDVGDEGSVTIMNPDIPLVFLPAFVGDGKILAGDIPENARIIGLSEERIAEACAGIILKIAKGTADNGSVPSRYNGAKKVPELLLRP